MKSKLFKTDGLKSPQDACIKCGESIFEGPIYVEPVHMRGVYVPEHMEWICNHCGFIAVGPTLVPATPKLPPTPST